MMGVAKGKTMGVSTMGVSTMGVSTMGVSTMGVSTFETGLSDFHKMILTVLKGGYLKGVQELLNTEIITNTVH